MVMYPLRCAVAAEGRAVKKIKPIAQLKSKVEELQKIIERTAQNNMLRRCRCGAYHLSHVVCWERHHDYSDAEA